MLETALQLISETKGNQYKYFSRSSARKSWPLFWPNRPLAANAACALLARMLVARASVSSESSSST